MFSGCTNDIIEVDLKSFNGIENSYTYQKTPWGSSVQETQRLLPFELGEPFSKNADTAIGVQTTYMPEQKIQILYGHGTSEIGFIDDKLSTISFNITNTDESKSLDEFFTQVTKLLTDEYGEETECTNKSHTVQEIKMDFKTYKWNIEKDDTINSLQAVKAKSNDITDSVLIVVGNFKNRK